MPRSTSADRLGFATRQLHAGAEGEAHRARATPIHLSAGFAFDDFDQAHERFARPEDGFSYTRVGNPTTAAAERRIADLESGAGVLLVSSGQAATATAIVALAAAGDHVVASGRLYEGTRELLRGDLARLGIRTTFVADPDDPRAWEAAIEPATKLVFAESIANPRGEVADLEAIAAVAHAAGIPLVVDNTLATPYLLRPLEHGADIVVHSASKFLAGHGTALGGVVVDGGRFDWHRHGARFPHLVSQPGADGLTYLDRHGTAAFLAFARRTATRFGPTPSPLNAFLLIQGIETLSLRVERQSATALALAGWLAGHPDVESVDHPGLAGSPHHATAVRYLSGGFGSVFGVTVRGGLAGARAFYDALGLITRMTHLGDVRTLALHPASTTHVLRDPAELEAEGIGPGFIRLSVGLEDFADLAADLDQALAAIPAALPHDPPHELHALRAEAVA